MRVGVRFEPGLVHAIQNEVGELPGILPLLQYALPELFEPREQDVLTTTAYQKIGGVERTLTKRADECYESLTSDEQKAVRQLFLRLITPGEGTEDTRRRISRSELPASPEMQQALDKFGKYRLLTFDREPVSGGATVEVAHEILIENGSGCGTG